MQKKLLYILFTLFALQSFAQSEEDSLLNRFRNLDSLYMRQNLEGITIVGHNPSSTITAEKVQYRVVDDPDSKTQTILELLRKVPMVTVDSRNNITVNGSSEFQVYINGRPNASATRNPEKYLRSMPASSVLRIEVITSPGAKYDIEGVGGILNIITEKDKVVRKEEVAGSVHATAGNTQWGEDITIEANRGAWNIDAGLSTTYEYQGHSPMQATILHHEGIPFTESTEADTRQHFPFAMGNVDVGYQIDSISELHLSLAATYMGMREKGLATTTLSGLMYGDEISLLSDNQSIFHSASFDGSLDYQRFFGEEQEGSMAFTYQYSYNPSWVRTRQRYIDSLQSEAYGLENIHYFNKSTGESHHFLADFVIPCTAWLKINSGSKYSFDQEYSVAFRQQMHILALYAEAEVNHRWLTSKLGLRHEYTWQKSHTLNEHGHDLRLHYGLWAPSASITASIKKNHNIGLSYTLRVRRPGIEELDPFVHRFDAFTYEYGNPNLEVEKTHLFTVGYMMNLKRLSFNAIISHSFNNNSIERYSFLQENSIHSTYGNIAQKQSTSLNIFTSANITAGTRAMVNAEIGYVDLRSVPLNAHSYGWNFNCNIGLQQNIFWKMKFSANIELMSREQLLQGWESGMSMLTASLSRSFRNDRWSVSLSGSIGLSKHGDFVWQTHTQTSEFTTDYIYIMPGKSINIAVSYAFGDQREQSNINASSLPQRRRRH